MAQVTLRINGFAYTIGCQDGEEQHLEAMGAEIEKRIETIKALGGQSGEGRMLVMAALLMADDIFEMGKALKEAQKIAVQATRAATPPDQKVSRRMAKLAARAEEIAARLEHA